MAFPNPVLGLRGIRLTQAHEIQEQHREWIAAKQPNFGPEIQERFTWALSVEEAEVAPLRPERARLRERLLALVEGDRVICLPSAPNIALSSGKAPMTTASAPTAPAIPERLSPSTKGTRPSHQRPATATSPKSK